MGLAGTSPYFCEAAAAISSRVGTTNELRQGLRELREEGLGSHAAAVKCRVFPLQGESRIRLLASAAITAHDIAVTHVFQRDRSKSCVHLRNQ
jgi:hypothetical protein